jgi:hypothetical protein
MTPMNNSPQVISTVSQQWASRPDDQRFLSMADLAAKVSSRRASSSSVDVALDECSVSATDDGEIMLTDGRGSGGLLTHWSFGQLAQAATAPAGYLRTLPPELARINLQWGMEATRDDKKLLIRENGHTNIAAINSATYGRIWDSELVEAIQRTCGPEWKVPGASYASTDPKRASTLYASDRDVFIFLVNESTPIEVDGETLFRGMYAWNSETGSATLGVATMLYRYVCDNRNIWGPKQFREIRVRHTSGAPHRFAAEVRPQLQAYAHAGTGEIAATVRAAKACEVGKNKKDVLAWLQAKKFTVETSAQIYAAAEKEDGLNPRSVWGIVQGATDIAHAITHTDERVALERKASALLDIVAA